jgi:hypothetical protein
VLLRAYGRRWLRRRRGVARSARARWGETSAQILLESRGYAILGAQAVGTYTLSIDSESIEVPLRTDYLVERHGLRYVAEVKTGRLAPLIRTPATRRQLLEYRFAFDVDGVLLVDAEQQRVHVVRFPWSESRGNERPSRLGWVLAVIVVVAVVMARFV